MKHNVILRILATITVTTVFFISSNFTIAGTATDPNLNEENYFDYINSPNDAITFQYSI